MALISGGARGQGATEGQLFVDEGAKVVLADILDVEGEATAAQIREKRRRGVLCTPRRHQ